MNKLYINIVRAVVFISVCCGAGLASGQSPVLSGTVTDQQDGTPLAGVIVQLTDAGEKILGYALTNKDGHFSLRANALPEGARLTFACMSYRKHSVLLASVGFPLAVALTPEPTQIREITVKAPDILQKGDTLVYNVEKFADEQDRSIADVLKKMPGIEVSESGQVRYNGEPINKFYIEGSDLLEGRYGLASNNISHKDVKNVEIMENHQPVRALEGIEHSEQAALNLRLKEDAKLRWVGTLNGGAGFSPALWDASLFAMRIAGKWQSMESFKANNTGANPGAESNRFVFDNILGATAARDPLPDYVGIGSGSAPLDEKRTRFNRSVSASTNNSFKVGKDHDLRAQITYTGERLTAQKYTHTDYLDETIAPFSEYENGLVHTHDLSALVALQANTPKYYLKNNLETDFGWRDADSRITGSSGLRQRAETPSFQVSNNLQLVRRTGNRTFTVSSLNRFVRKPHSLSVGQEGRNYRQDVRAEAFQSVTEGSFGWTSGRWQWRTRSGVELHFRSLESSLTGIDLPGYALENDASANSARMYFRPSLTYQSGRWRATANAPVSHYAHRFRDRQSEERFRNNRTFVSPTLSVRYTLSAKLELSAGMQYGSTPPNENRFYPGAVMNSYRYLSTGFPLFEYGRQRSANVSLQYRNPIESLFANAGITRSKNRVVPLAEQIFAGDYIVNAYTGLSGENTAWVVRGSVSKGLSAGKVLIGLEGSYSNTESVSARNGESIPYASEVISLSPRIKGTVSRRLATEYNLTFSHNRMTIGSNGPENSYANLKQKLTFSFSPSKKWRVYGGAEHYHNRFSDRTTKELVLLDAGSRWVFSEKLELQLSGSNLLDRQEYSYTSYGPLNETIRSYRIRPRNILLSLYMRF